MNTHSILRSKIWLNKYITLIPNDDYKTLDNPYFYPII